LTGTPFRMGTIYKKWGHMKWMMTSQTVTQMICRHYPAFWRRILYVKSVKELQQAGYLTPLKYYDVSLVSHENIKTNKTKSDFDLEDFERVIEDTYPDVAKFVNELPREKILMFCSSVEQAEKLKKILDKSEVVTATTPKKERTKTVNDFRNGSCRVLLNVGIYTVGFDVPDLDCIVVARPTKSLRLWSQILGRGNRLSPGKEVCHVYDLVGNFKTLGTLESMEIKKIDNKWNVVTNTCPTGWHNQVLYEYKHQPPTSPSVVGHDDDH
jgi:DNA repair protein RadD